jgi:hypothetical protein
MKRRPSTIPPDTWPPRMLADMAAGYCGERHVEDFLERVGTTYPEARVIESARRKFWYRADLDRAMRIGTAAESNGMAERLLAKVREKRGGG